MANVLWPKPDHLFIFVVHQLYGARAADTFIGAPVQQDHAARVQCDAYRHAVALVWPALIFCPISCHNVSGSMNRTLHTVQQMQHYCKGKILANRSFLRNACLTGSGKRAERRKRSPNGKLRKSSLFTATTPEHDADPVPKAVQSRKIPVRFSRRLERYFAVYWFVFDALWNGRSTLRVRSCR